MEFLKDRQTLTSRICHGKNNRILSLAERYIQQKEIYYGSLRNIYFHAFYKFHIKSIVSNRLFQLFIFYTEMAQIYMMEQRLTPIRNNSVTLFLEWLLGLLQREHYCKTKMKCDLAGHIKPSDRLHKTLRWSACRLGKNVSWAVVACPSLF